MPPLDRSFFERSPQIVAQELLGACLVRSLDGVRLSGWILETEAYDGEADLACHARAGLTPRTRVMYGPAGHAYIYFTYGMHWMLNAVTGPAGWPAAVLIRSFYPLEGLDCMARLRPLSRPLTGSPPPPGWTDGPAKLCQVLALDGSLNGVDLCDPTGPLFIEPGQPISPNAIVTAPRVGINSVPEPWKSKEWNFQIKNGLTQRR